MSIYDRKEERVTKLLLFFPLRWMVFTFAWQKLTVDDRTFVPVKVMLSYPYLHNAKTEGKKRVQNGKVISLGTLTTPTWEGICGTHMCGTHICYERDVFIKPSHKIIFPNNDITQINIKAHLLCLSHHCFWFLICAFFVVMILIWNDQCFLRDFGKGNLRV